MSPQQYILKEKKMMERQCKRKGLSESAWVSKYAHTYYKKHAYKVLALCFDGYKQGLSPRLAPPPWGSKSAGEGYA